MLQKRKRLIAVTSPHALLPRFAKVVSVHYFLTVVAVTAPFFAL